MKLKTLFILTVVLVLLITPASVCYSCGPPDYDWTISIRKCHFGVLGFENQSVIYYGFDYVWVPAPAYLVAGLPVGGGILLSLGMAFAFHPNKQEE